MAQSKDATRGSRGAAVVDPSFLEGLEDLTIGELRRRRNEALAEREFQSYLRRLVQVRQDILMAERERRHTGGGPQTLVERLTAVLSEGPQARGRGEALRVELPDDDIAEAERRADEILGGAALANPERLADDHLDEVLGALAAHENVVSMQRAAVIRVHDRFQEELKRRYRDDPSQALEGL